MKTKLGVIAAVLALCCAFLVAPVSEARAEECTTQGALALALADVLGIKVTSAQAAADTLAALGVAPLLGWDVDACITDAISLEIRKSFALLNREAGSFERALAMIDSKSGRQYPPTVPPPVPPLPPPPPPVSPFVR
jgi:hypothetical protein